jgi:hypothetical protein
MERDFGVVYILRFYIVRVWASIDRRIDKDSRLFFQDMSFEHRYSICSLRPLRYVRDDTEEVFVFSYMEPHISKPTHEINRAWCHKRLVDLNFSFLELCIHLRVLGILYKSDALFSSAFHASCSSTCVSSPDRRTSPCSLRQTCPWHAFSSFCVCDQCSLRRCYHHCPYRCYRHRCLHHCPRPLS